MNIVTKIGTRIEIQSIHQQGENSWLLCVKVNEVEQVAFPEVSIGPVAAIKAHNEAVEFVGQKWAEGVDIGQNLV